MIRESLAEVEPRSLMLIASLLGIVFATVMLVYMIRPQYQIYQQRNERLETLKSQIESQVKLQDAIDVAREKLEQIKFQLHGEAGAMPVNEMESYLVGQLQEFAWDAGVELTGVRPGVAKRVMGFEELAFNVDVTGAYRKLYDWLDRISNKLGFMLVSRYNINTHGTGNEDLQLNMSMTIVFYQVPLNEL